VSGPEITPCGGLIRLKCSNRLGWAAHRQAMQAELPRLEALTDEVRSAGLTHALLLGMGGSSLAPEVLRKTFGVKPGYLDLAILDSTDPGAVLAFDERLEPQRTLSSSPLNRVRRWKHSRYSATSSTVCSEPLETRPESIS